MTAESSSAASNELATLTPQRFAKLMQCELDSNASKGNWEEWKPDIPQALNELDHHRTKLIGALLYGAEIKRDRVTELCADLANIAMKIAEMFGVEVQP